MRNRYSLLAASAIALLLISGCADNQPNDKALYRSSTQVSNEQKAKKSKKTEPTHQDEPQENDAQSIDTTDDTMTTPTADDVIDDVAVSGTTWEDQTDKLTEQLDNSDLETVRNEITPVAASEDKQADSSDSDALESDTSGSNDTPSPSTNNTDVNVPDQTANRLIIAKVNGIDIHTLDQYSDADILAARQAAEAIGADAGYSYQYLLNNL